MAAPTPAIETSRRAALSWAARAALVLGAILAAVVGLERVVLAYPARLGLLVDGFPTEALVAMQGVHDDVAFFGDSVVQTIAIRDSDPRYLPDMVAGEAGLRVVRVSQAATGADLHEAWLDYLAHRARPPMAVVIPVNARSFSPHWEQNPGWVFRDVAAGVRHPLLARLASVLEWDWGRPTEAEFVATPVVVGGREVGTVESLDRCTDVTPTECMHGRYLTRYAADYARSRRLGALRDLVRTASAQPFPVVLYLTPVDVEGAREVLDEAEMAAVEANLALLRAELARSRWPAVDGSTLVAHADFDHPPDDPHEHLRGPGRRAVAEAVGPVLREALGLPPREPTP